MSDFEGLRAMGLIRGGSLENAIVLSDNDILNGPVRFPDEFVRHKALDLIGDLALIGKPLKATVVAHKAGHALHTQLVTRLLADPSLWEVTTIEHLNEKVTSPTADPCPSSSSRVTCSKILHSASERFSQATSALECRSYAKPS